MEDLLSFAQVDHADPGVTLIPSDAALNLALTALQIPIAETGARILRQPLPEVMGNQDPLTLVFQNLIGNSQKYRGAETRDSNLCGGDNVGMAILRRDNGIGFDPAYAEKTFRIFKRLHSSTEYPGTGIGLSSARKIVAQMGGRIWAESHVGAGAAFHFTIPKAAVPISPAPAPQSAPH